MKQDELQELQANITEVSAFAKNIKKISVENGRFLRKITAIIWQTVHIRTKRCLAHMITTLIKRRNIHILRLSLLEIPDR